MLPELINTKPNDLKRVEISRGSTRLVFDRREGSRWQMTEPGDVAADPAIVETLAFNLKELTKARGVGQMEGKPEAYGLQTPAATVTLWGEDGSKPLAVLDVGVVNHDMRYVRSKATGRMEVVDAKGLVAVDLPATRWRDRSLIPAGNLTGFKPSVFMAPLDPSKLSARENSGGSSSRSRHSATSTALTRLSPKSSSLKVADGAQGFVADNAKDLAPFGLDTPSLTFTVAPSPNAGSPQVFHLGKVVQSERGLRFYARRDDQDDVVLVDPTLLKDLGANPLALHAKKVARHHCGSR